MQKVSFETFQAALKQWEAAAIAHLKAAEAYRLAHARILLNSLAKPEAERMAEADLATADLRKDRDRLAIEAASAHHLVIFLQDAPESHT